MTSQIGADSLLPGHVLGGRYRIERPIGSGAMGTVYAASQVDSDRPVALKVISEEHTSDPTMVARFQREGRVMLQMHHPNIVEIIELAEVDGRWLLAMELLQGMNLADAMASRPPYEPAEAVPVMRSILDALDAAHERQVVHRDLKPANVFLARGADRAPCVKILDFGIAKVVGQSTPDQLTRSGTVVGTPEFMSPEQAMGRKVDPRSDLYAAGCIAYAMLCGRPPFVDDWPMRVVMKQAFAPHMPPSQVRPQLAAAAAALDAFFARALEKNPEGRYQSAKEMRASLETWPGTATLG
jgi:serine/threonine-protein kinase